MNMAAFAQFGCAYSPTVQFFPANGHFTIHGSNHMETTVTSSNISELSITSNTTISVGPATMNETPSTDANTLTTAICVFNGVAEKTSTENDGRSHSRDINLNTSSTFCGNGRALMKNSHCDHLACSCDYYKPHATVIKRQQIQPTGIGFGIYGPTLAENEQNIYPSISVNSSSPCCSKLSSPCALKDSSRRSDIAAWKASTAAGLQSSTGHYAYNPTLSAYGYGGSYDLMARRKNATRESTITLKAWLDEHKKNPYPTKGEKIMLAIITKMTLTQVSTWFANARRRLKKDNKITWEPKSRTDDDDEVLASDEEKATTKDVNETVMKSEKLGAAEIASSTASCVGTVCATSTNVMAVGGDVIGSYNAGTITAPDARVDVGNHTLQTRDTYQVDHLQSAYPQGFYCSSSNANIDLCISKSFTDYPQPMPENHIPFHPEQSVLTTLSKHVSKSTSQH